MGKHCSKPQKHKRLYFINGHCVSSFTIRTIKCLRDETCFGYPIHYPQSRRVGKQHFNQKDAQRTISISIMRGVLEISHSRDMTESQHGSFGFSFFLLYMVLYRSLDDLNESSNNGSKMTLP